MKLSVKLKYENIFFYLKGSAENIYPETYFTEFLN